MKVTFAGKILFMTALSCAVLIPITLIPCEGNEILKAVKIILLTGFTMALVGCGVFWIGNGWEGNDEYHP